MRPYGRVKHPRAFAATQAATQPLQQLHCGCTINTTRVAVRCAKHAGASLDTIIRAQRWRRPRRRWINWRFEG